ncbi:MAG TPA: glycosyltransferase family 2 protein [Vicinamibacterales bacterium]|jgi:glycosyltransferase involved in cell wall biosynthesis|nr:glycosyltransferase family 2 protein [Vicinamibacterales bacterium]
MKVPVESRVDTWVVIAAYNEGAVIGGVVRELVLDGYTVIVVDDGSRDDTGAQAQAAGAVMLRHAINRGQGAALQSGFRYALDHGARIVVTFDADGQHDVSDVSRLVEPILGGEADIALGSRFLEHAAGVPPARRMLLRAAVAFTSVVSGVSLTDAHNGMRALSRRAAEQVDLRLDRMAHASEIIDQIVRTGLRVTEVPVAVRYTPYSVRKGQHASAAARIALDYLFHKLND